jgi:curved DNA-binding protein CbpA
MARPGGPTEDYYGILGCTPDASPDEIRRAYRRRALECHPDRNPGDPGAEERFKRLSEAYAVLTDPARRRAFDEARRRGVPYETGASREDLFRDLFGDPRASRIFEELAGELARMGLRVDRHDFERTLFGGRAVVSGRVFVVGPFPPVGALLRLGAAALRSARAASARGEGEGAAPGARVGGALARAARWLLGLPAAAGAGREDVTRPLRITRVEAEHGGRRAVTLHADGRREEVLVTIPAGLAPGTRLRLRGKGRSGPGGRRGDAYLTVEVVD